MIIVVIAMSAMMGAAAFAIDIGAAWSLRRNLITGTDAAALAAAAVYAGGGDGCGTTDDFYLAENAPSATLISCVPNFGSNGLGYVGVTAQQQTPSYFGRVLGLADIDVPSYSAARVGTVSAATGLRPFGICTGTIQGGGPTPLWLQQINAYVANPSPTTIEITYGKDAQTDPCNDQSPSAGSGNWGTLDLDDPLICPPAWDLGHPCNGNPNPNPDLAYWTGNGFERPIEAGFPGQDCVSDAEHCWDGDTGADMNSGPVKSALNSLTALTAANDPSAWFVLPLFDWSQGNGGTTNFHIVHLVRVRLVAYCFGGGCTPMTPPPAGCNGAQCNWFLRLEFAPGLVTGTCCGPPTSNPGALVTTLCAVDPADHSSCS